MAAIDVLLGRLAGVKATAPGAWIARCPAHEDRRPSLAVRAADDRVLVHCFAGCAAGDIVAALDLELADLFDRSDDHRRRPVARHQRIRAIDLLALVEREARVVLMYGQRMRDGCDPPCAADHQRLAQAVERIAGARRAAGGGPPR